MPRCGKLDTFIQKYKPDYFIISPTAESGVSVTVKNYFTDKFTFFTGVQGTNSQHQILFRLRDDSIPHYVFCPERSMVRDRNKPSTYSDKKFSEICQERRIQSALLAADGTTGSMLEVIGNAISRSDDDWFTLSCKLGALDNFEMNNLRKCLIHALEEAGHDVELIEWQTDNEVSKLEKQAAEAVRNRYALELYQAIEFPDIKEASKVSKNNPGKDVQRRIEKTYLLDKLPGIQDAVYYGLQPDNLSSLWMTRFWLNLLEKNFWIGMMFLYKESSAWTPDGTPLWSPEFISNYYLKDKHFITQQQRFYMLHNFDISRKRSEVSWYYAATNQNFFWGQLQGDSHLQVWALQQLNIMQFTSGEYYKDSPGIVSLINTLRERKDITQALNLNLKPPTDDGKENIRIISGLLGRIGLKFGKPVQKLVAGVKTRIYSIDTETMLNPVRLAVLEAIARKFDGYLESEKVAKVNWEESPVIEAVEAQAAAVEVAVVEQVDELTPVATVLSHESSADINPELASVQQTITTDTFDIKIDISHELTVSSTELAIKQLQQVESWEQVTQEMVNLGWWSLSQGDRDRLTALYQQWQQTTMPVEKIPSPGSKCKAWYYSQWLEAVVNSWENRPDGRFFKAVVSFLGGGGVTVWQREGIQLFEEAIV